MLWYELWGYGLFIYLLIGLLVNTIASFVNTCYFGDPYYDEKEITALFNITLWPFALFIIATVFLFGKQESEEVIKESRENSELKVVAAENVTQFKCLVCHGQSKPGQEVIICSSCEAPHHKDCFNYLGRCARYGCRGEAPLNRLTSRSSEYNDYYGDDYDGENGI